MFIVSFNNNIKYIHKKILGKPFLEFKSLVMFYQNVPPLFACLLPFFFKNTFQEYCLDPDQAHFFGGSNCLQRLSKLPLTAETSKPV